jgi:DNA-binding NarL/FixJ family response regulator
MGSTPPNRLARIVSVDDHPIMVEGLRQLLAGEAGLEHVGGANDARGALKMVEELQPDLVVVDISLKQSVSGIDLLKQLRERHPKLALLVLSVHDEAHYVDRALRAGANGYVLKDEFAHVIVRAIRQVLAGMTFLSEQISDRLVHQSITGAAPDVTGISGLSDRELEVLRLIGQGFETRHVAARLFVSVKTVETYRQRIKDKLDLAGAAELVKFAVEWVNSQR